MASSILPGDRCSFLPIAPTNGQVFVDSEGVRWVYSAENKLWERSGTSDNIPLADNNTIGLLSSRDKQLIDGIPKVGGGFGIIVDPKLLLKSPTNPEGVITGDIKLRSESLDIICVGADRVKLECANPQELECTLSGESPGLLFKLSDKFLDSLIIDLPGPPGGRGDKGDKGPTGIPGFSEGPTGEKGQTGQSISELCNLTNIIFNDLDGLTDTAIVRIESIETDSGSKLQITKAKIDVPDQPADKLIATPISRSAIYNDDPDPSICSLTRLDDWTIAQPAGDTTPLDIQLLRLSKGSNDTDRAVGFNGTMSLSDFVGDIVNEYKTRLEEIDLSWGKEVREYITNIDDKARGILSGLANSLAMCEFNLPATEYCITFIPCDNPVFPPPPPPPSPTAAAVGRAGETRMNAGNRPSKSVSMGARTWQVNI